MEFVSNVYLVGGEKVIQGNIRDITERKQVQETLLKSEALLRELSVRDHLTGLFNRRYMEETLERELLRASRKGLSLGIMMLDVDDFKQFNDIYGYAAGDTVLRELGDLLLGHFRGDEFIIVLLDASLEMTSERAERLCEHARHLNIQFEEQALEAVTFSVGVAVFPENGITGVAIFKSADTALYRPKREGRGPPYRSCLRPRNRRVCARADRGEIDFSNTLSTVR